MRRTAFALLACLASWLPAASAADPCPDREAYAPGRALIAELDRIVAPGGVQEAYEVEVNGVRHWVNVRGQDRDNPLLLFVHGGPASPVIPTLWQFQRPLEEYFTIVHYDQRASGRTFRLNPPEAVEGTIKVQQYVDDAIALAEHLRQRYGKRKLVLAAHSWGTVVGMHAALQRPDLFHAYVGMGQVIHVRTNERLSFEYGLARARAEGNAAAVAEMESIAPYPGDAPLTRDRIVIARKWPQYYGGLSAFRDNSDWFFQGPRLSPDYDDADRCAINAGNVFTLGRLLDEFLEVDFRGVREFPIPVVMFMGRHDYTTPSGPTAEWLRQVRAPYRHGEWFERAAHMIPWEEPGHTLAALLQHVRPAAVEGERTAPAR
ncbi:alpha/beta fold hydrolase [Pseudoxanthomonas suwonensis]|jgi:Predicted hydrolases or acyltransferases (alpha/beta hydrolase superfamily)